MIDFNSRVIKPSRKYARSPRAHVGVLPSELILAIMSFSAGSVADLTAGAATAWVFRAAAAVLSADGNAAVWEHEFQSRDTVLHRSFLSAPYNHHANAPSSASASSSWRGRLRRLVELGQPGPTDLNSVPTASGLQLRCADVVLHRHPAHGFLLHLSEFRGTVVAYALRPPPSAAGGGGASSSSVSATKAKIDLFHCLPEMPDGHRPRAPAATLLLLRGVNDHPIHTFHSLAGVLACVQAAGASGVLCHWRFVECPARAFKELPPSCMLAPLALAAVA
jgi:hypothetical protein